MLKYIIPGIILVNFTAIMACVHMGRSFDDVSLLFQERQAITFLSGIQLAIISILSLCIYTIKRLLYKGDAGHLRMAKVWLLGFVVFAFAVADEFFMIHEGIDGGIATIFWGIRENLNLDGITLALYGVVAVLLFFKFKNELLRYRDAIFLFCAGGAFFLLSIGLDLRTVEQFKLVLEESSKVFAVGFLLSGFAAIFYNVLKELELKVA